MMKKKGLDPQFSIAHAAGLDPAHVCIKKEEEKGLLCGLLAYKNQVGLDLRLILVQALGLAHVAGPNPNPFLRACLTRHFFP